MAVVNRSKATVRVCLILTVFLFFCRGHYAEAGNCTPFAPGQYSSSLFLDASGNPHVAWEQILDNGQTAQGDPCNQNDIYYTSSADGGVSFLPVTAEIDRILTPQARVSLAIDPDGNPAVVWADERGEEKTVYFSRSFDSGQTFTAGVRIDTSSEPQDRAQLLFDSAGNPVVTWIETYLVKDIMNPVGYIHVTKSLDGGQTFLPSVCLFCGSKPYQGWHSMAIDSQDNPMIVTHYYSTGKKCWDVYFMRSNDQGASFETPVLVEFTPHHQIAAGKSVLALDSQDNPYIAVTDKRSGHWNIRLARSTDGGATFLPSVAVDSYATRQVTPSLKIDVNDDLYIAWTDERTGNKNIRFTMSEDGGITFRQSIPVDQRQVFQNRPSLDVDFSLGIVHITWTDHRQGICYIYHAKSIDNGVSFLPSIPVFEYPLAP